MRIQTIYNMEYIMNQYINERGEANKYPPIKQMFCDVITIMAYLS